jgi:hypothetical protein
MDSMGFAQILYLPVDGSRSDENTPDLDLIFLL